MSILTLGSKKKERRKISNQRESKKKRKEIPNQRVGERRKKEEEEGNKAPDQGSKENRRNV